MQDPRLYRSMISLFMLAEAVQKINHFHWCKQIPGHTSVSQRLLFKATKQLNSLDQKNVVGLSFAIGSRSGSMPIPTKRVIQSVYMTLLNIISNWLLKQGKPKVQILHHQSVFNCLKFQNHLNWSLIFLKSLHPTRHSCITLDL